MLRSLFPQIDWPTVKTVGFDMDGTLYDEAEFIAQVYRPISIHIAHRCSNDAHAIYMSLMRRWLEKGSSYSHLFSDVLALNGISGRDADHLVMECVQIFRNHEPSLHLPTRVKTVLDHAKEHFGLFIVTDGSSRLQRAKFDSLGLGKWFLEENIGISGDYGLAYQKPSIHITRKLEVLKSRCADTRIVFFGDREVDREFSEAAGFEFIQVSCLKPIPPRPMDIDAERDAFCRADPSIFLGALSFHLKRGDTAYKNYLGSGKKFLYARILKENNEIIRKLIIAKGHLLPLDQQSHALALIEHIDVWRALWEETHSKKAYSNNDEFSFENSMNFPARSVAALASYYSNLNL